MGENGDMVREFETRILKCAFHLGHTALHRDGVVPGEEAMQKLEHRIEGGVLGKR